MEHLAIDLGGKESQICVRSSNGQIVEERRCRTATLPAYLATRPRSRVVVETCSEAFRIADAALSNGHEVRVVPGTLVRSLGVGARRVKTDRRDAQVLSEVSCRIDLPSVHVPSRQARERKTMCGMREALVGTRTKLINTVRGWLRAEGRRPRSGERTTFAARVRALYAEAPLPTYVERQLRTLESLNEQIADADRELATTANADPIARRLMTVPGVGPSTSVRFVAALDEISRFRSAHTVESYLGLVPGEDSSADRKRRTRITKAGPTELRWCLVQAAWAARRARRRAPMQRWADEVEKRRGRRVAALGLARTLPGILFATWRDGTASQTSRSCAVSHRLARHRNGS
jgi:transposase